MHRPDWRTTTSALLATALAIGAAAQRAPRDLEEHVRRVLPSKAEARWLEIPWQTNLMRARQLSQQQRKPMFIWLMDGHVLGCT
ncbi:MAG: hypothetical protein AAF628_11685 [Planctomycetota bacterium]